MNHLSILMHLDSPVGHGSSSWQGVGLPGVYLIYCALARDAFWSSIGPVVRSALALLRRSPSGLIAAITKWLDCADHNLASLRRSQGGSITAITEWHYSGDH
jgi:hypothetical protein